MTHINQINEPAQSFAISNTKDAKSNETQSFENALSNAFDTPQASASKDTPANGLNEIISPTPGMINSSDIISEKTNNLLKMLDSYSSKLEDPQISLKNIAPVVETIKENAGNLLKETRQLTDADEGLRKIATQTAAMAQTEYVKFQRGDYLP